jgi:hypothetical protein
MKLLCNSEQETGRETNVRFSNRLSLNMDDGLDLSCRQTLLDFHMTNGLDQDAEEIVRMSILQHNGFCGPASGLLMKSGSVSDPHNSDRKTFQQPTITDLSTRDGSAPRAMSVAPLGLTVVEEEETED